MLSEKSYNVNSLNQYTAVNSRSYSYDADGNLLSDGTRTFTWDKKNRMTTVTMGTTTVSYVYDHNDLRVKKTVTKDGVSKVTRYIYDGSLLLAEYENDVLVKVYINDGEGVVGMVRYLYNEGAFSHYLRLYYLYDTLGSVAQVTAENGLPLQEYLYTPYGEAYNTKYDSVNGLRFVGRYGGYTDDDTRLTYFWHRWYDSADGRFISRDPENSNRHFMYVSAECNKSNRIYQEISNIYLYALNAPHVYTDITGLYTTARCVPKDFQTRTAYLAARNMCYGLWGVSPMPADLGTYSPSVPGLVGRLYNCGQKPDEIKYISCLEGACKQFCEGGADCKF